MFCNNCGKQVSWKDKKCPECGAKIKVSRKERKRARREAELPARQHRQWCISL